MSVELITVYVCLAFESLRLPGDTPILFAFAPLSPHPFGAGPRLHGLATPIHETSGLGLFLALDCVKGDGIFLVFTANYLVQALESEVLGEFGEKAGGRQVRTFGQEYGAIGLQGLPEKPYQGIISWPMIHYL